jgi:thiol-disulfide isomerase/thioredoxin
MNLEIHYIGAKWCKSCHAVKPTAKELAEESKLPFIEHDYDTLSEKDQATIVKLPTIQVRMQTVVQADFIGYIAADSLRIYLQSKKLLPEEEF